MRGDWSLRLMLTLGVVGVRVGVLMVILGVRVGVLVPGVVGRRGLGECRNLS